MVLLPTGINLDLTRGGWALIVGAAAIISYVVSSIIAWRRLRQFKGPFLGSFSYLWIIRASYSGRMGQRWAEAEAQYGTGSSSTVRIGPNELLTSDPDVIRRTSATRSKYTRSAWYKMSTVDPNHDAMLNVLDTAKHDKIKAQTAPGYAGKDNPGLEAEVDYVLALMVDKIRTKYASSGVSGNEKTRPLLDLANMAQFFTLDSISKLSFGEEFGLIREERDIHRHIESVGEVAPTAVVIAAVPYLRTIVGSKFVLRLVGPKAGDERGLGRIMACVCPLLPQ